MEHAFIAWAKRRSASLPQPLVGIGDDAAVIASMNRSTVVTTDSLCEGSHFLISECGPRAVGRKLAGVNLSDLAAMAATPTDLFLSLCLPSKSQLETTPSILEDVATRLSMDSSQMAVEIFEGVFEYAEKYGARISGGDTNVWNGPLVVSMTAIGLAPEGGCWLRSGAQVGDTIVVTGSLGGSLLGKHLNVQPRLELAQQLRKDFEIHAATDISDGLGIDLQSIFSASGCGAEVDLENVPISEAAHQMSKTSGKSPLDHALGDGEDFELILAMSASEAKRLPAAIDGIRLTKIGSFVSRTGLWSLQLGKVRQLPPKGFVHGKS